MNYYNEFDPYAAQWLRNLIEAGHIPQGEVDSRSIKDVRASDLTGFVQCHFFAGLGGWSHALRLAGWPEDRPVWTGSCPCQPFSAAGAGGGVTDERHLWPTWFNLIRECRPRVVFGEQVEAAINHGWLDLVQADLEGEGYACGAVGLPAGGVGAPHIRQRLWFVAESLHHGNVRIIGDSIGKKSQNQSGGARIWADETGNHRATDQLADADSGRHNGWATATGQPAGASAGLANGGASDQLADAANARYERRRSSETSDGRDAARIELKRFCNSNELADDLDTRLQGRLPGGAHEGQQDQHRHVGRDRAINFWSDCDWLPCRDGKARPVEPGTFPLAHGATARVGRLRAYGNAIVPQVAQVFIEAYLES
jgi:DNA (cytosine-5)-methyltransferase 1